MIFLFIISTYLSEALKARAFGYPAKRLSKIQRILMIAVSSIFGTVSIIAIFSSFFIDGWFNKSQITEYMSQMEFYTFCKNMISFSGNTTMRNIMLACFIVPAIISIVMILWFDISEKRSSRTLVNDVLFIPLIIAILLDSYNIITSWWFPFIIILLSVIVIYMNIIKEVSSMIIRSNSSNLSMRLIEKSLKILSKKEGCDENCKNQIDTIAEMMIRDPTISFNLKKKRSSKKESNIINMIFEKKDLMIRNLK
jgi:hypothetical protein